MSAVRKRKWGDAPPTKDDSSSQQPPKKQSIEETKALALAAAAKINAAFQGNLDMKAKLSAAANAAARINAMFAAKNQQKTGAVPQVQAEATVTVDINDCSTPARVQLTRSSCHRDIEQKHNVIIAVKGRYLPPGASNPNGDQKLHIHITGPAFNVQTAKSVIEAIKKKHDPTYVPPVVAPQPTAAVPPQNPWAWGKGAAAPLSSVPLTQLTQKGMVATGIAAGPVMGAREARGLAFGLHRQDFTKKKTIKLLIGIEVKLADGFPLLQRITGLQNSYFIHIMKNCPGTLITLHGNGSKNGGPGALHIRIFGKVDENLTKAKKMADDLVANVRLQFKQYKYEKMQKAQAQQPPVAAAAPAPWATLAAAQEPGPVSSMPPQAMIPQKTANTAVNKPVEEYDPLDAGSDSD